ADAVTKPATCAGEGLNLRPQRRGEGGRARRGREGPACGANDGKPFSALRALPIPAASRLRLAGGARHRARDHPRPGALVIALSRSADQKKKAGIAAGQVVARGGFEPPTFGL